VASRRREQGAHTVELIEVAELDGDSDAAWPGSPAATTGRGGRSGGQDHARRGEGRGPDERRRRRGLHAIIAAAVVICVVGTAAAVGGALERQRAERVAAQVGGLWPLGDEPAAVWRASTGQAPPAVVDGGVVLVGPDGALTARDLATGERLWSSDLPSGRTTCGPDLLDPGAHGSPLVCVTVRGEPASSARPDDGFPFLVTVLDASGQVVGARGVADVAAAVVPLAGGRIATAAHDGGRVVVTWEDALDGTVERVQVLEGARAPVDAVGSGAASGSSAPIATDHVEMAAVRGEVRVRAFDSSATFDSRGERVGGPARLLASQRGWLAEGGLPGGLSATFLGDQGVGRSDRVDVVGPDGELRFSLAGEPFVPEITGGTAPGVLVTRMPGFTGYDASTGERLWHRPEWPEVLWLQTDDVIVVESGSRLLAFEARSGRALWQRWLPTEIVRVLTDGDSVLLVMSGDGVGGDSLLTTVLSVSLFDGGVEWRRSLGGEHHEIGAAQGMLFAMTRTEVWRLGRRRRIGQSGRLEPSVIYR
jgi:outer membrane protein assembly factor BamB